MLIRICAEELPKSDDQCVLVSFFLELHFHTVELLQWLLDYGLSCVLQCQLECTSN